MDLVEITENVNRHPWELSRTDCILNEIKRIKMKGTVLDIGGLSLCMVVSENKFCST